jgi:4-hydroxy-3-polyprenylbenzoate decarboxylase
LREWLEQVEEIGELRRISGAALDEEIPPITEIAEHAINGPAVLFDQIPGFAPDQRILVNPISSLNRTALMAGFPVGLGKRDYVRLWQEKLRDLKYIPPQEVSDGPILENVLRDDAVDVTKLPAPIWHKEDGGRYIGTGDSVITRDPDSGRINLGTYRVSIIDQHHIFCYISPGKHGRINRDKYFAQGKPCPIAISLGHDPLLLHASATACPVSEYEWVGGVKGAPVNVVRGEVTGLPIPAYSEIVLEGEVSPTDKAIEGPFGEWTGYYASASRPEHIMTVKRMYYRNNPINTSTPPARPPTGKHLASNCIRAGLLGQELKAAGLPDVQDIWFMEAAGSDLFTVLSIKQRYPGHATQAGHLATFSHATAYLGRIVVVVDDDIDVYDAGQVIWAISTRCDPAKDLTVVPRCWSGPLDPIIPEGEKGFNSRLIIDATRPWEWRDEFPGVVGLSREEEDEAMRKWGKLLFGEQAAHQLAGAGAR